MRKILCCGFAVAVFTACAMRAADDNVEHGRYLVEDVAKCGDCHTPYLQNGQLDKSQWLKGTMLTFKPTAPIPNWKAMAPDLTPGGSVFKERGEAAIEKFLETAVWPDGDHADPPMPQFHLKPEDAKAVIAYLKTLK
jgi:mono/diheme cytochrome c family protein